MLIEDNSFMFIRGLLKEIKCEGFSCSDCHFNHDEQCPYEIKEEILKELDAIEHGESV
jgi:Zn-finger protein